VLYENSSTGRRQADHGGEGINRSKEGNMSSISGVTGGEAPVAPTSPQGAGAPAPAPAPAPAADPDHDGDTDKPGQVDLEA
jgi:hypothetical protein